MSVDHDLTSVLHGLARRNVINLVGLVVTLRHVEYGKQSE